MTKDEQINFNDTDETLANTQSTMSLSTIAVTALSPILAVVPAVAALDVVRSVNADEWEKERTALYQQLDEKVPPAFVTCQNLIFSVRMMKSITWLKRLNVSNLRPLIKMIYSLRLGNVARDRVEEVLIASTERTMRICKLN